MIQNSEGCKQQLGFSIESIRTLGIALASGAAGGTGSGHRGSLDPPPLEAHPYGGVGRGMAGGGMCLAPGVPNYGPGG